MLLFNWKQTEPSGNIVAVELKIEILTFAFIFAKVNLSNRNIVYLRSPELNRNLTLMLERGSKPNRAQVLPVMENE